MPTAARLTGVGTFLAADFDETVLSKVSISGFGTAFAYEFDENVGVAVTLTGSTRMRYLPLVGVGTTAVVFDSINEIDPFGDMITDGLVIYNDAAISYVATDPVGQADYTITGADVFTVPNGVTTVSAVCIGAGGGGAGADNGQQRNQTNGGGGGGALSYGNITVTSGETLTIAVGSGGNAGSAGNDGGVGGNSTIVRSATTLLSGGGGNGGTFRGGGGTGGTSGGTSRTGGGSGGAGGTGSNNSGATGGGGAGGYSGNGGAGGGFNSAGSVGSGGGGGGGGGYNTTSNTAKAGGGGGVEILGSGSNGTAGTGGSGGGGGGGSSGTSGGGSTTGIGGTYGGGGGGKSDSTAGTSTSGGAGQQGAIRIVWGSGRSYPSTNVTDQTVVDAAVQLNDLIGGISVFTRDAFSMNSPYWTSNNSGVVNFDGVAAYMYYPGNYGGGVVGTNARTSIIWFKVSTPNVAYRLFGWGDTSAPGTKWNLSLDATTFKPRVEIGTGAVTAGTTAPSVIDGNWHMVATSCPANGTANDIKIYIDGNLITDTVITSGTTTINTASTTDMSFGASLADASPGYFAGQISSFIVYSRQLSDLEIKVIYRTILNRYV